MTPFVFHAMGTVVSVTCAGGVPESGRASLTDAFEAWEQRFSLWRPDAEGARVARRELPLAQASAEYRSVYERATDWRTRTQGAFTPHRPDGEIDLSGIVKALAIAEAGEILDAAGVRDWCVNGGGDVLVSGHTERATPWVVGIVDPDDRTALLSQYTSPGGRRAVATSGTAERGEHVWRIGADATFHQVTVVADDIETADVLATAILAGGTEVLDYLQQHYAIDVLACARDGRVWASPVFRA